MKKEIKIVFIWSVILLILVGTFCFLKFLAPKVDVALESTEGTKLNSFKTEKLINEDFKNLDSIEIKNEFGEYIISAEKKENNEITYHLTKNKEEKISDDLLQQSIIENLVAEFEGLMPVKIVEENCEDLTKYGLKNEKNVVVLRFNNGKNYTFILGNEASLSVGYYVKEKSNEKKVYLITEPAAENFLFPADSFLVKATEG